MSCSSSRREVRMSMWKEGNRRRSTRISGLNASGTVDERVEVGDDNMSNSKSTAAERQRERVNGPASPTRARKKRKLRPLQDVAAPPPPPPPTCVSPIARQSQDPDTNDLENGKEQNHEHRPSNSDKPLVVHDDSHQDQPSSVPSAPWMPEKHVLELILNVLQRKDTHEIFAEPVDREEVEDYYEIIKEPMDFGTMRAKLHEGMYKNLEQFQHDVFLISENAMHFNSSGTIYFRQARIIHELSKKVFHALKTDPNNFELEFSETRRRTSRRSQNEAKVPTNSSSPKPATNFRTNSMTVNVSSKNVSYSLGGTTILRRSIKGNPECSTAASPLKARDNEMPSGTKCGRRISSSEADRRSTYIPGSSFINDNDSIVSSIYNHSKTLKHVNVLLTLSNFNVVNQRDVGYRESLMLFVRDLGPAVQMIAKQKLHGWSAESSNFQTSTSGFQAPQFHNPLDNIFGSTRSQTLLDRHGEHQIIPRNSRDRRDLCNTVHLGKYAGNKMDVCAASVKATPSNEKKIPFALEENVCTSKNNAIMLGSNSSTPAARELNFPVARLNDKGSLSSTIISDASKLDDQARSLESTLEYSQSNMLKLSSRNHQSASSLCPVQSTSTSTSPQTNAPTSNLGSSQCLRGDDQSQSLPLVSQFTFDLPYLKTQLDQISTSTRCRGKTLQQCPGTMRSFPEKMSYPKLDSHQQPSLDSKHTDLVLQL